MDDMWVRSAGAAGVQPSRADPSLDASLHGSTGDHRAFLHVIVQSLWHLWRFRKAISGVQVLLDLMHPSCMNDDWSVWLWFCSCRAVLVHCAACMLSRPPCVLSFLRTWSRSSLACAQLPMVEVCSCADFRHHDFPLLVSIVEIYHLHATAHEHSTEECASADSIAASRRRGTRPAQGCRCCWRSSGCLPPWMQHRSREAPPSSSSSRAGTVSAHPPACWM